MMDAETPRTPRDTRKRDTAPRGIFLARKGVWAVRFACRCSRFHEESIGPVKGDAVRTYWERKAQVKEGWCPRQQRRTAVMLFSTYASGFAAWATVNQRSWVKDGTRLSRVLPVLGGMQLDSITTADVERFLDSLTTGPRAVAPATRNRYRDLLSGMCKRAVRLGLVKVNPVTGIPKAKEAGGRLLYLPPATKDRPAYEEQALRDALPDALRPWFDLSINTGLRWSEQAALRWRDMNVLTGALTITHSKNGHGRSVPMNAAVRSLLLDLSLRRERPNDPDEPVFQGVYRAFARSFEQAVKAAQDSLRAAGRDASMLDGYTWHSNRHTFASRLVMAGVDLLTVQRLGGWRTLSMVSRYAHLAPGHLREAVERLSNAELPPNLDRAITLAPTPAPQECDTQRPRL